MNVLDNIIFQITTVCQPEQIYLTRESNLTDQPSYDLLVLLEPADCQSFDECLTLIHKAVSSLSIPVYVCVTRTRKVLELLPKGHIFFTYACQKHHLIYDSGTTILTPNVNIEVKSITDTAYELYTKKREKAICFLDAANYFKQQSHNHLAAFMLSQSVILLLIGFLRAFTSFNHSSVKIPTLLKLTHRITNEIVKVLSEHPNDDDKLLIILSNAYTNARYRDNYKINEIVLGELFERVNQLLKTADIEANKRIKAFIETFGKKQHENTAC
jgi:HEPN domain-containing protein